MSSTFELRGACVLANARFQKSSFARLEPFSHLVYVWIMALRPRPYTWCLLALTLVPACGTDSSDSKGSDKNGGLVPNDIGSLVDANNDGVADQIDVNRDGIPDGWGLDTNGDGVADALLVDLDCDGVFESYDTNGDGKADRTSASKPGMPKSGCVVPPLSGSSGTGGSSSGTGGAPSTAGSSSMGGSVGTSGSTGMAGSTGMGGSAIVPSQLGKGIYQGTGTSSDRYAESDLYRDGVGYKFMANGWGDNWQSHNISWNGTSFDVLSLNGSQGANYSPAGYPTVFCGLYSEPPKQSIGTCGLPATISALKQVRTGWRWKANGNSGQYNAAWDIWLGNGDSLSSYLMVWLRDPPGQQPAGRNALAGATVPGLPGSWNIHVGSVNGHPIVNYVKAEGQDLAELEFDVLDVYKDALKRNYELPGNKMIAVAVGFEVWNGPITNLSTEDFYVDVK